MPLEKQWGFDHLCREFGVPVAGCRASKVGELHLLSADGRDAVECPDSKILDGKMLQTLETFLGGLGTLAALGSMQRLKPFGTVVSTSQTIGTLMVEVGSVHW